MSAKKKTYAILKNPAHSRVSFLGSDTLAINELTAVVSNISAKNIRISAIGGVPYVLFDCDNALCESAIIALSRLSFVYAIFEIAQEEMLRPLVLNPNYFLDSELSSILKYTGKTNELFTRLMLNLAQLHIKNPPDILNILDPMAGKGTTLYEALMQGHNAYGVEVDDKMPGESVVYLKKYLETTKHKHENHTERISGQGEICKFTSVRNQIKIAGHGVAGQVRHFEMVAGDTRNTFAYFKKNHFHAIIADLPYGVQHGSKSQQNKTPKSIPFTRNAMGLISEAIPGWVRVLKPGGVIVLAWNLFLISKHEIIELLAANGFTIPDLGVDFSHRVDQAIDRDLIIGVKK